MSGHSFSARDEDAIRRLKEDPDAFFSETRVPPFPSLEELDYAPLVDDWVSWCEGFICGAILCGVIVPLIVWLVIG